MASEAADTARFSERKWVWVPDEKEGYVAGYVNRENEIEAEIVLKAGGVSSVLNRSR